MDFDIKDYLERMACKKIVSRSKYESPDTEIIKWWNQLFKDLERKSFAPNHTKRRFLHTTYSIDTFDALEKIGVDICDDFETDISEKSKSILDTTKQTMLDKLGYCEPVKIDQKERSDPYNNFMRKSKKDAQIWRAQKKTSLEKLSLMEKAENVTENIATDFDEWFINMGGSSKKSEIDKDIILELFKIQFNYPAASSLNIKQEELASLPNKVAIDLNKPELSEGNCIKQEIKRDIKKVKKAPPAVAFGKLLPLQARVSREAGNIKEKWLRCYVYHDELTSMATTFKDIVELQSTRSFCKWLLTHPEIPPAKFLKDNGLTDEKVLGRRIFSAYQNLDGDLDLQQFSTGMDRLTDSDIRRPSKVMLPSTIFNQLRAEPSRINGGQK